MTPRVVLPDAHPPEEVLADLACGQADRALRVVLEAHLELCPRCRGDVAEMARPGGDLLAELRPATPPSALLDRVLAGLPTPAEHGDDGVPDLLPAAARAELGPLPRPLAWRRLPFTPVRWARLLREPGDVELLLIHYPGERRFPRHRHVGGEQVTVLAGGYTDPAGHFDRGDFGLYAPGTEHAPVTDAGEPCWIVTRIAGGVRFQGPLGLLQRLATLARRQRRW